MTIGGADMAAPARMLRAVLLIAAVSVLGGCTITSDGAFFTGTSIGIGDGHTVAAAPDPPADICCWHRGYGRWF